MLTLPHPPMRHLVVSFATGALLMALLTLVGTALAQTPIASPTPFSAFAIQQMIEWCSQMMSTGGTMMQGVLSGMCMGR